MDFAYKELDEEDQELFQRFSTQIDKQVRETFPSIPSDFELKPVTIRKIAACGTMYDLKFPLPDGQFAKVSFVIGALYVRAPGDTSEPEQTFSVDPTPNPSAYD